MTSCHGDRRKSAQGPQAAGLPLRLLLAHVSSHTATQDRHGHTPRHCWHTTHRLGSTEHPPFACSRTTQQPATAVHSPVSVHNTSSTGNAVRVCRQGTEAKTHQPELQADGPPSSTSTFHTHASSETILHTNCSSGTLLTRSLQMAQLIVSSSSTWLGHTRSENVYRGPLKRSKSQVNSTSTCIIMIMTT